MVSVHDFDVRYPAGAWNSWGLVVTAGTILDQRAGSGGIASTVRVVHCPGLYVFPGEDSGTFSGAAR